MDGAAGMVAPITVAVSATGESGDTPATIRSVLAAGQLTLFIFLTSLTGAGYLLSTRQLGVTRRVRAGPVTIPAIVTGEALGRFLVALLQAGIVLFGSMLLFGVDWGAPRRGGAAVRRHVAGRRRRGDAPGNRGPQRAAGGGHRAAAQPGAGGAGGIDAAAGVLPRRPARVAFVTPHAWMNDALWRILVDGDGLAQVWRSIAVLMTLGAVLLAAASVTLARSLR